MYVNAQSGSVEVATADNAVLVSKKKEVTFAYDPSGLRTPRSANLAAFNREIATIVPDHLPAPEWMNNLAAIEADCAKKNIPLVFGRRYKFDSVTPGYNEVTW